VDCYTLMSKVGGVLRLVTTNGQQIAWNHDFITLDPRLVWRASMSTDVVLQFFGFAYPPDSGITLTGGESAVYRLHLSVTNKPPVSCEAANEKEPNNSPETAQPIELPATVHGVIGDAGDQDRFRFTLKKSEVIEARVDAAAFGSPLDAWLKIEDRDGNILAQGDDSEGSRDPRVEWKAPTNGTYIVAVGSVTHRGGEDHCYRMTIQRAAPDYRAALGAGVLELEPGKTNDLKIELKRLRGFTNDLAVVYHDLPIGVTALTTRLAAKENSPSLRFAADGDAADFQGPIRVIVIDREKQQERVASFDLTTRGETGFNHLLVETTDHFWLTVRRKPAK
jgi:hypothetical protein